MDAKGRDSGSDLSESRTIKGVSVIHKGWKENRENCFIKAQDAILGKAKRLASTGSF